MRTAKRLRTAKETRRLGATVPEEMYRKLEQMAIDEGTTLSVVVNRLLSYGLMIARWEEPKK